MLYLSIAAVICVLIVMLFIYFNPHVDTIVSKEPILSVKTNNIIGYLIVYKRTYKNGKVLFVEKKVWVRWEYY